MTPSSATAPSLPDRSSNIASSTCASLSGIERVHRRADGDVTALAGIDLEIHDGEWLALTGPSGSGKSTLLQILGLLDRPTAGRYILAGEEVAHLEEEERAQRRGLRIGFVFQAFHLVPHLTLVENVSLPLMYAGIDRVERQRRATATLEGVGLGHRRTHRPDELSGGEQQRAALARAIVHEPELLLADEPTGNLDEASTERVLSLLRSIHTSGRTVVLVTHDERVAAQAGRALEIRHGRIV